jgi:transposase
MTDPASAIKNEVDQFVLGVSAMAMLRALAQGETDPARMADMAKKQLRKKIPQLQLALQGCLLPHHRWLLGEMIDDLDHVAAKITRIEETIEQQMRPFQEAVNRWLTVPGIKHRLAWTLVAEVGPTVEAFPSAADLVSWTGVCPRSNQTGGKRKSGTTGAGNPWLLVRAEILVGGGPVEHVVAGGKDRISDGDQRSLGTAQCR